MYVAVIPAARQPDPQRVATITAFFAALRAGDYAALRRLLTADAITRWPQSGERITGALACVRVYESYPDGPPAYRVRRVTGEGDAWVAELSAEYGTEHWYAVSIIEFEGPLIARMTDYFGPAFPAPEWRQALVDPELATA